MNTLLLTGGAGFIGANMVRAILKEDPQVRIVVLDALTYAGNEDNLRGLDQAFPNRYRFVKGDVADGKMVNSLFQEEHFSGVLHFAAESHVDRSITHPEAFVRTNVIGTFTLLEIARKSWGKGEGRFLQVSTDEVYGELGSEGFFTERTPIAPSSPYSASKASADHLVAAYHRTYGMNTIITRCCNNYGPYQFPEKLIPLMVTRALKRESLPVYGEGLNVRDWIHVEDHNKGVWLAFTQGKAGEVYNLGARCEARNIDLVHMLCEVMAEQTGCPLVDMTSLIAHVPDRPGHDFRYAIDPGKAESQLGFTPGRTFLEGMRDTIRWYLDHSRWWERILDGSYRRIDS